KVVNNKPSRLKELTGTLAVQVQTPSEALISVDNVLQSARKTNKGKDGSLLAIHQARVDPNGVASLGFDLRSPTLPGTDRMLMVRGLNMVRVGAARVETLGSAVPGSFALTDSKGKTISASTTSVNTTVNANETVHEYKLVFRLPAGKEEPVKFVYSGR